MQGSDSIYEIARLMRDENYIRNDFNEAVGLVVDFFRKKYISSLENEIKAQRADIESNPSREIKLLSLMKEFMPKENHDGINNAINALTTFSAISSIQKNLTDFPQEESVIKAASAPDPSVKQDGVYDIDENCRISAQTSSSGGFPSLMIVLIVFLLLNSIN